MCNGMVHPTTQETITKYQKIIDDDDIEFRNTWIKAMCKELGQLVQGYNTVKGTNTIHLMTHKEIKQYPLIEQSRTRGFL